MEMQTSIDVHKANQNKIYKKRLFRPPSPLPPNALPKKKNKCVIASESKIMQMLWMHHLPCMLWVPPAAPLACPRHLRRAVQAAKTDDQN